MENSKIPSFVRPFLWSYDISKLNLNTNKRTIIHNVLNFGSEKAVDWLRSVYTFDDMKDVFIKVPKSAWGKKSLALWSLIFGVSPEKESRFA